MTKVNFTFSFFESANTFCQKYHWSGESEYFTVWDVVRSETGRTSWRVQSRQGHMGGGPTTSKFPCCVFHICNFDICHGNGKYKCKIMKIRVNWEGCTVHKVDKAIWVVVQPACLQPCALPDPDQISPSSHGELWSKGEKKWGASFHLTFLQPTWTLPPQMRKVDSSVRAGG